MTYEELQQILYQAKQEERGYNYSECERLCNVVFQAIENEKLTEGEQNFLRVRALHLSGNVSCRLHQYPLALEKFSRALDIAIVHNNRNGQSGLLDEIGGVYWLIADYPKALEYYHKALTITEELGVLHDIAKVLADIGLVYMDIEEYERALKYYQRALAIAEKEQDKSSITIYLGNIGNVYGALEDYNQCLEYHLKGLSIAKEIGNLRSVSAKLSNIGIVYRKLNEYSMSMEKLHESLSLTERIGDKYGITINLINMAELYSIEEFIEHDIHKAIEYDLKALKISEEIKDRHTQLTAQRKLAEIYKKQQSWELFALTLEKYYTLEKEIQSEDTKRIADKYAYELQIVEQEKQIAVEQARNEEIRRQQYILEEQAAKIQLANIELQERNIQLDSAYLQLSEQAAKIQLTNTELQERNIELDNAYLQLSEQAAKIQLTNTELQERNIELDNAYLQLSEQAAKIQMKNTELHETNIELNTANQKLDEAGKFKMKILGIASHDLKNPIAGINLSAEVLMRYEKLSPQSTKMMKNILNSSKRMLDIVVNLMDVSARELGQIKLTNSSVDITTLVEDISKEYLMRAAEKKQTIEFLSNGICTVFADEQCLRQVFDNLISNAIKYSEQEKLINISVTSSEKKVKIAVADQGQGLSNEDKVLMFRDFQKLSSKPTGGESSTGLGLSVVKHFVELHGGKVWAESEGKGMGSTFVVELPILN